jgi:hypothetical protein
MQKRLIALLSIVLLAACNPVKQVLKSKEKTDEVVRQYVKENPPKNDTTFIPGEVIFRDTTIRDSVPLPYPVNHRYTETRIIEQHIRDTIKVIDRSFIEALNNRLEKLESEFTEMKADRDRWKSAAQIRLYWLLGLILIIVGAGVFYVIRILQPKITLMK